MLTLSFGQFFYFLPITWLFLSFWVFFFFYNVSSVRIKAFNKFDSSISTNLKLKENTNWVFLDFTLLNLSLFFFFCILFRGWSGSFFFENFVLNNTVVYFLLFYLIFFFFLIYFLRSLNSSILLYDFDFFFSLVNFFIFSNLFFLVKSFMSFYFVLELISCFVFYQFISSKNFYFKVKQSSVSSFSFLQNKQILSVLFFQYWASFFSSVILVYVISVLTFNFGSTDWYVLNFLFSFNYLTCFSFDFYVYLLLFFFFTVALFLKLGFTPVQLFKIEIYKGLPFLSIFFYTVFYFFVYFFFFFLLFIIILQIFDCYYDTFFFICLLLVAFMF